MRPGNGATNVPANTVITLFTSAPMNAGTIAGALYVSQNGVLISGTTTVGSNGQSIEFTPSSALGAGASVKVFLNSTAQDIYGNYLTYFSGQFTVAGSPANTAATVQAVNPFPNAANVPLNTVIQVEYDQALAANTISSSSVHLYQYSTGTTLAPTLSLVGNGQVINIAPTSNLVSGSSVPGMYLQRDQHRRRGSPELLYSTSPPATAADTVKPTILTVGPPNASTNIGTNAGVSVTFNKAVNPVSITGNFDPVEWRIGHRGALEHQLHARLRAHHHYSAGSATHEYADGDCDQRRHQRGGSRRLPARPPTSLPWPAPTSPRPTWSIPASKRSDGGHERCLCSAVQQAHR